MLKRRDFQKSQIKQICVIIIKLCLTTATHCLATVTTKFLIAFKRLLIEFAQIFNELVNNQQMWDDLFATVQL